MKYFVLEKSNFEDVLDFWTIDAKDLDDCYEQLDEGQRNDSTCIVVENSEENRKEIQKLLVKMEKVK